MTADEKTALAFFLNTADGYLKSGYRRESEDFVFADDDESELNNADAPQTAEKERGFSSLPLAYQIDEYGEETESENEASGDSLETIADEIKACAACPLGAGRTNAVPGEGVSRPLVLIIGEAPGADEDASGRPFTGKAGQLLDRMLGSIGLSREKNCFIANVIKCRPPKNRDPEPAETGACAAFLARQIKLLKPLVILCAGRIASRIILKSDESIGRLRGGFGEYEGIPVLPTYHPSALLRDESYKRPAWEDLKMLKARLAALNEEYAAIERDS